MGSYANVEITIICRDGSRLRLAERRDYAPLKGDIFDTADTGLDNQGEDRRLREKSQGGARRSLSRLRRPNFKFDRCPAPSRRLTKANVTFLLHRTKIMAAPHVCREVN
jgi:hypothetical protein